MLKKIYSSWKSRDKAPPKFRLIAILCTVIVIGLGWFFIDQSEETLVNASGSASVNVPKSVTADKFSGEASESFNQALIKKNKEEGENALKQGRSHVASLTNSEPPKTEKPVTSVDILERKASRQQAKMEAKKTAPPEKEPPPKAVKAERKQTPSRRADNIRGKRTQQKQEIAGISSAVMSQMKLIEASLSYTASTSTVYADLTPENTPPKGQRSGQSKDAPSGTPKASYDMIKELGINPGDVFYAANGQLLDTDSPAPMATVEIIQGPLAGSTAIGSFKLSNDEIAFTFSELTDKDGKRYTMKGFAVDPATHSYGVVSEVDYHRLSRWGGLFLSSGLKGWANAVKNSGAATATNVASSIVASEFPEYSTKDQIILASGEVASELSTITKANFNRPPTAWLYANEGIGVMIIDIKPQN